MLGFRDILGSFLKLRSLRCDLADTDVDADRVVANIVRSELFCNLEPDLLGELLEAMDARQIRTGTTVMKQGDRCSYFYVIAAGNAIVTHVGDGQEHEKILAKLSEPTGVGDETLLDAKMYCVTVKMESAGILLRITRDEFADFVSDRVVEWVSQDEIDSSESIQLWVEEKNRRLTVREGTMKIPLYQLRDRMNEFDRKSRYCCCSRDGRASAIAAFILAQRGFKAVAVRDGRNAVANAMN